MADVRWSDIGGRARAFRVAHAAFSIVQLACLGYVWFCAAKRRRDRLPYPLADDGPGEMQ